MAALAAAAALKGEDGWAARVLGAADAVTERTGATVVDKSVQTIRDPRGSGRSGLASGSIDGLTPMPRGGAHRLTRWCRTSTAPCRDPPPATPTRLQAANTRARSGVLKNAATKRSPIVPSGATIAAVCPVWRCPYK